MKRVFVALIAGTVLSGVAAAYAATLPRTTNDGSAPTKAAPTKGSTSTLAATE